VPGFLKERVFGSTALHLVRKCPCPVWVVRPSQPERYTRILAAVDPSSLDDEQNAVNVKIMDLATALAQGQQCALAIVHTWTFPAERSLRCAYLEAWCELERWIREAQDQHRRRLAELVRPYPLHALESQVFLLKGEPGRLIPELASKLEIGLIVMGSASRAGVAGLFTRTTAERILRRVDCAVLAVNHDGFATPARLDEHRR
jgi:nucleotide-binding universal stress UspA family protein